MNKTIITFLLENKEQVLYLCDRFLNNRLAENAFQIKDIMRQEYLDCDNFGEPSPPQENKDDILDLCDRFSKNKLEESVPQINNITRQEYNYNNLDQDHISQIDTLKEIICAITLWALDIGDKGHIREIRNMLLSDIFILDEADNIFRIDLRHSCMHSLDFSGFNLSNVDLRHSDLRYSNFSGADFSYADLSYCDFEGSDISNTSMRYTNLSHANLDSTILTGAIFDGTIITETIVQKESLGELLEFKPIGIE